MFGFIKKFVPNIHAEGYQFIIIAAFITLFLSIFSSTLAFFGVLITLYVAYFFRDPTRIVPTTDSLIISPADGVVCQIIETEPPHELGMKAGQMTRVSIFLNIFNVHVNRIPCDGRVAVLHYNPGKFLNASLDKASVDNERQSIKIISSHGNHEIGCIQIAGLIARRIVCDLENNQEVAAGDRFGIIRFGSRVDIYMPTDIKPIVTVGQTMIGGETIIADLEGKNKIFETKIK